MRKTFVLWLLGSLGVWAADPAKLLAERGNIIGTVTPAMKAAKAPPRLPPPMPKEAIERQRISDAIYELRTGRLAPSSRVGVYSYDLSPKYKSAAEKLLAERGNIIGAKR